MAVIPNDVITDILSRLPVKPLLRFRCVHKSWRALVDSDKLVKLHLNKTNESNSHIRLILQEPSGVGSTDFESIITTNVANLVDVPFLDVIKMCSCNGLICIVHSVEEIHIWNPSIKSTLKLPPLRTPLARFPIAIVSVVCGFGYDAHADDYKFIILVMCEDYSEQLLYSRTSVYSLKLNSWREIMSFPYYAGSDGYPGVYTSGSVHWVVTKTKTSENQLVGAFNLATEKYHTVKQPNYDRNEPSKLNLGSLGGCLSLILAYRSCVDIWVMKEYGKPESWTNTLKIDTSLFGYGSFNSVRTLEYSLSGKELLLEIDLISLVRYDIEKKSVKLVNIRGRKVSEWIYSLVYQESLVQLKTACPSVAHKKVVKNSKKAKKAKRRDAFLSKGFKLVL